MKQIINIYYYSVQKLYSLRSTFFCNFYAWKLCHYGLELAKKLAKFRKLTAEKEWVEFISVCLLFIISFHFNICHSMSIFAIKYLSQTILIHCKQQFFFSHDENSVVHSYIEENWDLWLHAHATSGRTVSPFLLKKEPQNFFRQNPRLHCKVYFFPFLTMHRSSKSIHK